MLFNCPAGEINAFIELATCHSKFSLISKAPMNQQEPVIASKRSKVRPQVTLVDENTNLPVEFSASGGYGTIWQIAKKLPPITSFPASPTAFCS